MLSCKYNNSIIITIQCFASIIMQVLRIEWLRKSIKSIHAPMQLGTDIESVVREKSFPEPRLAFFGTDEVDHLQAFVVAEGRIVLEVTEISVVDSIISLIASYYALYISYPKALPAAGLLLFIQELLMEIRETQIKKSVRYTSMIDSILDV